MGGQKWSPWNPSTPLNLIRLLFLRSVVSSPASPGNSETRFSSISGEATTYVWNTHFFSSLFSVAFYPLPSLTSLPTTLGMGAVGKRLNQKESRIYGVILCFINSFYDIWGWNCFQRQVSLFGGVFLTVIHGDSWLSLPCLFPQQKHSNELDLPCVSSGTAVNLFTPSILEIMHRLPSRHVIESPWNVEYFSPIPTGSLIYNSVKVSAKTSGTYRWWQTAICQ